MSGAVGHGCWPLYLWNWEKISTILEKQKQIKRETGLGFALPCTRSVFILFYFIVGLLFIYLFIFLSIYFFFHSPFMNSGLGSEGNHIVTSHHHPNFPGVPPGAAGRVQWQTKNNNNVWIFLDILLHGRIHLYIPLCIRGWVGSGKNRRICFSNETFCTE